jgi:hypothetical protein
MSRQLFWSSHGQDSTYFSKRLSIDGSSRSFSAIMQSSSHFLFRNSPSSTKKSPKSFSAIFNETVLFSNGANVSGLQNDWTFFANVEPVPHSESKFNISVGYINWSVWKEMA